MGNNIEGKSSSSRARAAVWARQRPGFSLRKAQALCWVHAATTSPRNEEERSGRCP